MKCVNCMKDYTKDRAKFCPYCGAPYLIDKPERKDEAVSETSYIKESPFSCEPEWSEEDAWKDYDWYAEELEEEAEEAEIKRMNKRFIIAESILAALAAALTAAILYITLGQ